MSDTSIYGLLYCRVSDVKQTREGSGLLSQQHRCEKYAKEQGYPVEAIYTDQFTGGGPFIRRAGMMDMLSHIRNNPAKSYVIIVDDIMRLSRDTRYYLELRDTIAELGAEIECLNFTFEDSPEGEFREELAASTGKLQRRQAARQSLQKKIARLEAGYYAFNAPVGYKFVNTKAHGNLLVRDEPAASIIVEAFTGFASGRFQTKQEVRYFLENTPEFPKQASGKIGNNRAQKILSNPLYAGIVGYKPYGVELHKGKHEGLVSYETFLKVQERLKGRAYAPTRKNTHTEFVLRGSVICECGNALTGGLSKGKMGKYYAYYHCQKKSCAHYGQSIKRDVLHDDFEALLKTLKPSKELVITFSKMFKKLWDHRSAYEQSRKAGFEKQVSEISRKIDKVIDKMVDTESVTATKGLEKRIEGLESNKLLLEEKIASCGRPVKPFEEMYRTSLSFLENPHKIWASGGYTEKKAVVKLAVTDRMTYVRNRGYRTPEFSLPFKVLDGFFIQEKQMVPRRGRDTSSLTR